MPLKVFLSQAAGPYRERLPHVLLSGIVGPQGDAYERNEQVTAESATAYHSTQMSNLACAGVDVVQAMTFTSMDEAVGVIRAARDHGLPVILSFMPAEKSAEAPGLSLGEMIRRVDSATDDYALFYGLNCSHPREFEPLLDASEDWVRRIGLLRPNASAKGKVELCQIGHLERGDPRELAERMGSLAQRLPDIVVWGGCCGTWAEHLQLIADAIGTSAVQ